MAYKPIVKTCEICKGEFSAKYPTQKCCSQKCGGVYGGRTKGKRGNIRQPCEMKRCRRISHSKGLCHMHYRRVLRHGNTEAKIRRRPKGMSVHDWFMSKVRKKRDTGCWEWQGYTMKERGSYGTFYDSNKGKKIRAHHFLVPELPRGKPKMEYDHLCRNVLCVNPEHLEMVTASENRKRQFAPVEG